MAYIITFIIKATCSIKNNLRIIQELNEINTAWISHEYVCTTAIYMHQPGCDLLMNLLVMVSWYAAYQAMLVLLRSLREGFNNSRIDGTLILNLLVNGLGLSKPYLFGHPTLIRKVQLLS